MTMIPRIGDVLEDQEAQPEDLRLWSVTTLIGVLDKPALIRWAAKASATEAVKKEDVWRAIDHDHGPSEAIKWLANARFRPPIGATLEASELGTEVHRAAQQYALFGKRPDDVHPEAGPLLDQFDRWLDTFQPTYEAAEVVVYSPKYGYAGTADTFMSLPAGPDSDPMRLLIDYKTSREAYDSKGKPKTPYMETVLQLAAYRYAELAAIWRARRMTYMKRRYYLLDPGERALAVPVPKVDGAGCLLITPESCALFPMRADERAFKAFLYVLEAARWVLQDHRGSIGDPIIAPPQESEEEDDDGTD